MQCNCNFKRNSEVWKYNTELQQVLCFDSGVQVDCVTGSESKTENYMPCRQWCSRRGCKRTSKQFWFVESGQNSWKFGQIPWRSEKLPENPGKILTNPDKNGAQPLQKIQKISFFWRPHQKTSSWRLWEKICRQKLHKNFSGKFEEIFIAGQLYFPSVA